MAQLLRNDRGFVRSAPASFSAENMIDAMSEAGFAEVAVVWRMFADTILLAFTPNKEA